MLRLILGLALGWLLLDAGLAHGQLVYGPVRTFGWYQQGGVGFAYGGRNWAVAGFAGGSSGYGYSLPAWGPVCHTPIGWAPPTVVIVQQPVPLIDRNTLLSRLPDLKPEPVPDRWPGAVERVDQQVKRGDLLVINPRGDGVKPAVGLEVKPPAAPALPVDPLVRAREAFADGWYGRAAELFAAAIAAEPKSPRAYFLLAQARTARGEYADAVAAIREGMKQAPDWPAEKFDLRAIFGPDAARFDEHLAELRKAATADPADPTLGFLLGYHLWFLGEKAEAVKLFRRAAKQAKDGAVIERFLVEADVKT